MIRKPPKDWGRESDAITAVRTVATTGKAAVVTGGRLVRGGILCAFGGLWTFAGLAAGLFGSFPTLFGAGGIGLLAIYMGLRIIRGPRAAGASSSPGADQGFGVASGPGASVDYSRNKLLGHAGFGVFAVLLAIWGAGNFEGALRFVMMLMIPVFALMTFGSARRAAGDLSALRWDKQGLSIRTLFSERAVAWSGVADIYIQQVSTYALFGLLRVGSQRSVMIRLGTGGLFSGRIGVSFSLLDLGGRTPESLVLELQAAQAGRADPSFPPAPQAAWAPAPPVGRGEPVRASTPIAPRPAYQPSAAPGSSPVFGRRGVGAAPPY